MSLLVFPRRAATFKPQQWSQLDYGNLLTQGIVAVLPYIEGVGTPREAVGGGLVGATGPPTWSLAPGGSTRHIASASAHDSISLHPNVGQTASVANPGFTLAWYGRISSSAINAQIVTLINGTSVVAELSTLGSTPTLGLGIRNTSATISTSVGGFTAAANLNVDLLLILTWSSDGTTGHARGYVNGKFDQSLDLTTIVNTNLLATAVCVGDPGSKSVPQDCYYTAVWQRALTRDEVYRLSVEPYVLWLPPTGVCRLFVPSAGVTLVTVNLGAGSAMLTARATPTVAFPVSASAAFATADSLGAQLTASASLPATLTATGKTAPVLAAPLTSTAAVATAAQAKPALSAAARAAATLLSAASISGWGLTFRPGSASLSGASFTAPALVAALVARGAVATASTLTPSGALHVQGSGGFSASSTAAPKLAASASMAGSLGIRAALTSALSAALIAPATLLAASVVAPSAVLRAQATGAVTLSGSMVPRLAVSATMMAILTNAAQFSATTASIVAVHLAAAQLAATGALSPRLAVSLAAAAQSQANSTLSLAATLPLVATAPLSGAGALKPAAGMPLVAQGSAQTQGRIAPAMTASVSASTVLRTAAQAQPSLLVQVAGAAKAAVQASLAAAATVAGSMTVNLGVASLAAAALLRPAITGTETGTRRVARYTTSRTRAFQATSVRTRVASRMAALKTRLVQKITRS